MQVRALNTHRPSRRPHAPPCRPPPPFFSMRARTELAPRGCHRVCTLAVLKRQIRSMATGGGFYGSHADERPRPSGNRCRDDRTELFFYGRCAIAHIARAARDVWRGALADKQYLAQGRADSCISMPTEITPRRASFWCRGKRGRMVSTRGRGATCFGNGPENILTKHD